MQKTPEKCIKTLLGAVLLFASVTAAAQTVIEPNTVLSLEECIDITLKNNPQISASYSTEEAQRNRLSQTKSNYLPQVSANANYSRSDRKDETGFVGAGNSYSTSVSATQMLYDFGKTGLSSDIQKNTYFSAKEDTLSLINNTVYSLKQAYYGVLSALENRAVFIQSVDQYQAQLKRAKAFYSVGTRPKIDVTTAQVNLNNAKLNLIQSENSVKTAYQKLMNIMGVYDPNPSFSLEKKDMVPDFAITQEEALKQAMDNRPDLAAYKLKVESARQNVKLSQTGYTPELNANGSYGFSGGDFPLYDRWSVGAGLSIPLFSGLSTVNKVKESKSNLQTAYYNLTQAEQNILLDVKTAFFNFEDAKSRIPVAKLTVQQAEENYQLAIGRYTVGVGNYIEVKDAEVSLSNSKLAYISAIFDYNLAIADLKRAMGTK